MFIVNYFYNEGTQLLANNRKQVTKLDSVYCNTGKSLIHSRGRHGCDRMVVTVGFTTTCAISAYHHWSCDFEPRSWRGVLDTTLCDKVCQWLATSRCFSPGTLFPPAVKLTATNRYWNIVENGFKHHQTNLIHYTHLTFIFILTNLNFVLLQVVVRMPNVSWLKHMSWNIWDM